MLLREGHGTLGRNEAYALEYVRVGMRWLRVLLQDRHWTCGQIEACASEYVHEPSLRGIGGIQCFLVTAERTYQKGEFL